MNKDNNQGTGIFYKVPARKFQQGGLTMGYGYKDPNKDMYRNIGDSSIFKNGVTGAEAGARASAQPIKGRTFGKQVQAPPNSSFSGNLLYKPKQGVEMKPIEGGYKGGTQDIKTGADAAADIAKGTSSAAPAATGSGLGSAAGVAGVAGAVNTIAQPALATLDDNDSATYTNKEAAGTVASSAIGTAATTAGMIGTAAALGATMGSAVPVIGTIVGAVVGAGIGFLKARKKKKQAKQVSNQKARNAEAKLANQVKKDQALREQNIVSVAANNYTNRPAGVPGGYLTSR